LGTVRKPESLAPAPSSAPSSNLDLQGTTVSAGSTGDKQGWQPVLAMPDGSPLANGVRSFTRYRGNCGESFCEIEVNAKPAQVMAFFTDPSRLNKGAENTRFEGFDVTAATRGVYGRFENTVVGVSNRDLLSRNVITAYPDGSMMESTRSIKDER
jgi:hypothetical protein